MGRLPKADAVPPAFFKIMIGDFLNKVCLPRDFLKNFNGSIPKKVALTSANGKLWTASVKKMEKDWFLCKKWSTFAKDNALEYGEFLVFKLNPPAGFSVSIYKKNSLEKVVVPSAEKAIVESNFHSEKKKQGKEIAETSKLHPQLLHEIKKDEATSTEKVNSEKSGIVIYLLSSSLFPAEHVAFVGTPLRPTRSGVQKKVFAVALGRSAKYQLTLPRELARQYGFTEKGSVTLVDQFGVSWPMSLIQTKAGATKLSSGWNEFRITRKLCTRDTCEFEYVEGMGNSVRVNIVPAIESKEISVEHALGR